MVIEKLDHLQNDKISSHEIGDDQILIRFILEMGIGQILN